MKICPQCERAYRDDESRCFVDGKELVATADRNLGRTLAGKYLVEEKLGEGGMATVYRARHVLVDRPVAVKILGEHVAGNQATLERFRREAKTAAALAHPNIVEIYDQGDLEDGRPFLVMELLTGNSLADRIAKGPIPAGEAAAIALQVAEGLARAHDFGVIHRDLKPDNIFVAAIDGQAVVKLLDFGIARSNQDSRITNAGELFGTPQYMAPERLASIDAGASQDLYALGVILFEMVTGELPFTAETLPAIFLAHMSTEPPRPSARVPTLPRRFEELILGLLAKAPEDRPVDAHAVIRELTALAPAELVVASQMRDTARLQLTPTLPPTTLERWARRTALFEEMIRRSYPAQAPAQLRTSLDELRSLVETLQRLRASALIHHRELDAMEHEARETKARFGYAMQRVGESLSRARESVRKVESEMAPRLEAALAARADFTRAAETLAAFGPISSVASPSSELSAAILEVREAHDRWHRVEATSGDARAIIEERSVEVKDLDFQVQMLRKQVDALDEQSASKRSNLEAALANSTREVDEAHARLAVAGSTLVEALRPQNGLQDLFAKLASEGSA